MELSDFNDLVKDCLLEMIKRQQHVDIIYTYPLVWKQTMVTNSDWTSIAILTYSFTYVSIFLFMARW